MHGTVVELLCRVVAGAEVLAVAGFVAEAPHHDRGVVAVAQHHAVDAVHEGRNPRLAVRDALVGMVFEVGFAHAVESVMVEHRIHAGVVGIMAGAHGVDVVLLHQQHVAQHCLVGDGAPALGIGVVAVHAFEEHALAVDIDQRILDFNIAEAVFCGEGHFLLAVFVFLYHAHGVKIRLLRAPQLHVLQLNGGAVPISLAFLGLVCLAGGIVFIDKLPGGVVNRNFQRLLRKGLAAVPNAVEEKACVKRSVFAAVGKSGGEIMVAHAHLRYIIYIYVAVDARHAEHILTFQIRAVAPAEHLHGEAVAGTNFQVRREVELCHIVRALRVAHVLAVEPYESSGVDAAEVDNRAAAVPVGGHTELAHVGANGIDGVVFAAVVEAGAGLDVRRCVGVGILHVAIYRAVVTEHFPVGGNGNGVPSRHVVAVFIKIRGAFLQFGAEVEFPRAVEREVAAIDRRGPRRIVVSLVGEHGGFAFVRHVEGYARLFVFCEDGFVFPVGCLNFGLFYLCESKPSVLVGGIVFHAFQHAVFERIHLAVLCLCRRANDINARLPGYRLEEELGVVPHACCCRPLQQIVNRGIAAAVVEVLSVKGVFYHAAVEVGHLDVPILPAVFLIGLLANDFGVVLARVAVAEHHAGLPYAADLVGQGIIEARGCRLLHEEARRLVGFGFILWQEHEARAAFVHAGCHVGAVGRHEEHAAFNGFGFPKLRLVGTVVLARGHVVGFDAHGLVGKWINDAPRAGQLAERPVLARFGCIGLFKHGRAALRIVAQHAVGIFGGRKMIEHAAHIALRHGGWHEKRKSQRAERGGKHRFKVEFHKYGIVLIGWYFKPHGVGLGSPYAVLGVRDGEVAAGFQLACLRRELHGGFGGFRLEAQRVVAVIEAALLEAAIGRRGDAGFERGNVSLHSAAYRRHRGRKRLLARAVFARASSQYRQYE